MLVKPGCSFWSLLPAPLDQLLKVGVKLGNIKERREGWECLEQPEGSLGPGTAVREKTGRWDPPNKVSESPSQESPTFQRPLDTTQPFLRGAGGVPFSGTRKCHPTGAAAHQDPSSSCSSWESHGGQTLAKANPVVPLQSGKSSTWLSFRKVKFIPEQALEQFSAPFPHRFGLFPVPSAVP